MKIVGRNRWPLAGFMSALVFQLSLPGAAQVTVADYERAMNLPERYKGLALNVAEPATWVDNEPRFHYRKSVAGGHVFVLVDAKTLERRPPFDHARLAKALSELTGEMYTEFTLPFNGFVFVDGGRAIEMFNRADTIRTGERGRPRWRCDLTDYKCTQVSRPTSGRGRGPIRDMSIPPDTTPVRSPDGRWEALIQDYDIAIRPVGGGEITLLSMDGSEGDFYELTPDAWSPDSRKLVAVRVRPGHQRRNTFVASSPEDRLEPRFFDTHYTRAGDAVDIERPVLFDVASRTQIMVSNELFPNPLDLTEPIWRKDSRAFTFEYNQRGHQVYRIIHVNAVTGVARALVSEAAETNFNAYEASSNYKDTGTRFRHDVDDGREILWMSERDGWKHLYLYDGVNGRLKNQVTRGEWVVRYVIRVDDKARQIWFAANGMDEGKDPYFVHFFRVNFDGSNLTRFTHENADHSIALSDDAEYYVSTFSRIDMAPVSELRRTRDNTLLAEIERGDISQLLAAGWKPPEVFTAKGRDGKTDIWGLIVRPSRFDPNKKYPVIDNIYNGHQGSYVPKSFLPFLEFSAGDGVIGMQMLAELGFIVAQIEAMGTEGRSKAFHDATWRNIGDAGLPDRIAWHKAAAERYPWYDISRVGIYGGSAGGQNSTGALLFRPDFYHVAVSYNGNHDNRMTNFTWSEGWMGWPVGPHYAASSNVDNAWRLKGRLLLVIGELDTNVDPRTSLQVAGALIRAGKTYDMLWIPGLGHGAGRSLGERHEYGTRARFDYFVKHLLGQDPPAWNRIDSPVSLSVVPRL